MADYAELIEKYKSPFYVFDFDKAVSRVKEIQARLPKDAVCCYAIKANPFLLYALKDMDGLLFEVCSEGELEICKDLGVAPEKIVFSGVMKNKDMIKKALDYGVKTVTLESLGHLADLLSVLPSGKTQEVIIRLSNGNQFGMSEDDVREAVKIISANSGLVLRGIHFFTGTQKKMRKISEEVSFIEKFCSDLKNECGVDFTDIEYGPGLSFEYFGAEDFSGNYDDLAEFSDLIKNSAFRYVVEMGRFIASPCGEYFTKICDIKKTGGTNYVIIDGGINHINYYGQVMAMKIPPVEHIAQNQSDEKSGHCICGSLCTTADVVLKNIELSKPAPGDTLVFKNIGAYSITEGLYLFLSHDFPVVLARRGGKISVLRDAMPTYTLNR